MMSYLLLITFLDQWDPSTATPIALLANPLTQAKSLLHNLKQAAEGIGQQVNADKTEYIF